MVKVLPNTFGRHVFDLIEKHLRNMAHSTSEQTCRMHMDAAMVTLRDRCSHSDLAINKLKALYEDRLSFADYSIQKIQSIRGRRGSTCSESNHSSIIINLNRGVRGRNTYTENPTTFFKDLLNRQAAHIVKWNTTLFNEGQKMSIHMDKLKKSVPRNIELEEGASWLCYKSFMRFLNNWHRAKDEYVLHYGDGAQRFVQSRKHEHAPPRMFEKLDDNTFTRCSCADRIAYEEQCTHEIVMYGMEFRKDLFAEWHQRRICISCSSNPAVDDGLRNGTSVDVALSRSRIGENPFQIETDEISSLKNERNTTCATGEHSCRDVSTNHIHSNKRGLVTNRQIIDATAEFCGCLKNCSGETKDKFFALLLDMIKGAKLDGKHTSSLLSASNSQSEIDMSIQETIRKYQCSFLPSEGCFQPVNPTTLTLSTPDRNVRGRQVKKRLMPTAERECRSVRPGKKTKATCSFCREVNHKVNTCYKRRQLSCLGKEFILCDDEAFHHHHRNLIETLEGYGPNNGFDISAQPSIQDTISTKSGFRHIVVEKSFSFSQRNIIGKRLPMRDMYFEIKFIDDHGNVINDEPVFLASGKCMELYFDNASRRSRAKKVFVYDRTAENYPPHGEGFLSFTPNESNHDHPQYPLSNHVSDHHPFAEWEPTCQTVTPEIFGKRGWSHLEIAFDDE